MPCSALAAAILVFGSDPLAVAVAATTATPTPVVETVAPTGLMGEPLFADIAGRADGLKTIVDGWLADHAEARADFAAGADFTAFRTQAAALSAKDMEGHVTLRERGTDPDLKCMLRGMSEDIPHRVDALAAAPAGPERTTVMQELRALLDDNAAVLKAPTAPPV